MSTEPLPPPSKKPINLAKLAVIFAVVFAISFGLCSISALTGGVGFPKIQGFLIYLSLAAEALCLLGLVVVGFLGIVRSFTRKSPN